MPVSGAFNRLARGTECIQSPEMLTVSRDTNGSHFEYDRRRMAGTNAASDVWGLGCLLFELFAGEPLFYRLKWTEFFVRITYRYYAACSHHIPEILTERDLARACPAVTSICPIVRGLLRVLLVRDRKRRPSVTDVAAAVLRAIVVAEELQSV